jgi:hypothetical protein
MNATTLRAAESRPHGSLIGAPLSGTATPIVKQLKPAAEKQQVQHQQSDTATKAAVSSLQPAAPAAGESAQQKAPRSGQSGAAIVQQPTQPTSKWAPSTLGDVLDIGTLFVTTLFLYYTIQTWKEMVRSNDNAEKNNTDNERHAEESLRLTRESNVLTTKSLEIAESTLHTTQRAYLMVDDFAHASLEPFEAEYSLNNVGLSVARVDEAMTCTFLGRSLPDVEHGAQPDYRVIADTVETVTPSYIYPGKRIRCWFRRTQGFSPSELRGLRLGDLRLFVFGRVIYFDIFNRRDTLGWARVWIGDRFAYQQVSGYDYTD